MNPERTKSDGVDTNGSSEVEKKRKAPQLERESVRRLIVKKGSPLPGDETSTKTCKPRPQ